VARHGKSRAVADRASRLRASAKYGRIRARAPRYAFLGLVVLLSLAGLRSIIAPAHAIQGSGPSQDVDYAEQSFAISFVHAYLTYDSSRPEDRERAMAAFSASGLEPGAGFLPPQRGAQTVEWADVAQVQRPLAGGVVVTVAAALSSVADPVYVSVPVDRTSDGAIYLAGYPSFVGPPLSTTRAGTDVADEPVNDAEVVSLVNRALGNYLGGDAENLSADLAQAATVTLPTAPLHLEGVEQLAWVRGGGAVLAEARASDARGGSYVLRYEVGVRKVTSSDPQLGPGWRITYIQTISQQS
jgi:hypothetical protein